MRNFKSYIYSIFGIFLLIGISNASNLENRVTSYFNGLANSLGTSVSSLLSENSRVKYLDLNLGVQEHLKPTISLTNVNMISEYSNSAIFICKYLGFYSWIAPAIKYLTSFYFYNFTH